MGIYSSYQQKVETNLIDTVDTMQKNASYDCINVGTKNFRPIAKSATQTSLRNPIGPLDFLSASDEVVSSPMNPYNTST